MTESGEVAGVTNDAKLSRKVSFIVTDDGKGNLSVSRKPDGDVAFTFTNTYNVTPVETSVTDQITANKVLTGRELKEGEFSFELVEGDKVVATGTNAADGAITMGKVAYDKPTRCARSTVGSPARASPTVTPSTPSRPPLPTRAMARSRLSMS